MLKKIFVCSPLRGNIKQNIVLAEDYCRMIALMGMIPIAPHAYFTRFLDDTIEMERELGMSMGMELLWGCDELWYFGEPSAGMKTEMAEAKGSNIPVLDGWNVLTTQANRL